MCLVCNVPCVQCALCAMCLVCNVPCVQCALCAMCLVCNVPCVQCALCAMCLVCNVPCVQCAALCTSYQVPDASLHYTRGLLNTWFLSVRAASVPDALRQLELNQYLEIMEENDVGGEGRKEREENDVGGEGRKKREENDVGGEGRNGERGGRRRRKKVRGVRRMMWVGRGGRSGRRMMWEGREEGGGRRGEGKEDGGRREKSWERREFSGCVHNESPLTYVHAFLMAAHVLLL